MKVLHFYSNNRENYISRHSCEAWEKLYKRREAHLQDLVKLILRRHHNIALEEARRGDRVLLRLQARQVEVQTVRYLLF